MDDIDLSSEVQVHRYREGDEERIVSFLEKFMGWPAVSSPVSHLDHWRWKFLSNPLGFHLVCVAERGSAIVSHSASLPVRLKIGEMTIIASQGVDLVTDPSLRGHGLIGRTMECRNLMKDDHQVELDFGFPNQAAYRLGLSKQGFQDLGIAILQHRYIINEEQFFRKVRFGSVKRLGYSSYLSLRRTLGRRIDLGGGFTIGTEIDMGEELDLLYQRASKDFDFIIARDRGHVSWRYGDPRGGQFIVRSARNKGRLVGYMVHVEEEREGTRSLNIVDTLVDPRSPDVLSLMLLDCISMAREMNIETVLCCLPEGHPYAKYLSEVGFLSRVRYTGDIPMRVIVSERGGKGRFMDILKGNGIKAHIMLGDTDWV